MPLMLMSSRVVFGWRISLGMRRLILLRIWVGVHQSEPHMDARRSLLKVRTHWYPIMQQLHRFMISVSGVAVNHDGKLDSLVWHLGSRRKVRRTDIRVNVDLASLPGTHGFLNGPWMQVHQGCIAGADVAAWPYSVGILCKFTAFLGTLHWLVDAVDMGHFGVFLPGVFSHGLYPGLEMALVEVGMLLLAIRVMIIATLTKGLVDQEDTSRCTFSCWSGSWASTPRRWKGLRPPSSEGVGSEVGVPRNLFPRLGVG